MVNEKIFWKDANDSLNDLMSNSGNSTFDKHLLKAQQALNAKNKAEFALQVAELKDWKDINDVLSEAQDWIAKVQTKSQPYKDLVEQLSQDFKSDDLTSAKKTSKLVQDKRAELTKKANARNKKKKKAGADDVSFGEECFTAERKNNAAWKIHAGEANDFYWDHDSVEMWNKFTEEEKDALWRYTADSSYLTEPLRAIDGHHYYYDGHPIKEDIINATSALNKCAIKKDAWIKRDDNPWCFEYIFDVKDLSTFRSNPDALVGKTGIDRSFMSCGDCKETYFGAKEMIYNIYCPAGTKGIYAEPFSQYGGAKRGFDGVTKPTFLNENEIILQRGTQFRVTKAEYTGGKWYIDLEVIGQKIEDYELKKDSGGWFCDFK